MGGFGFWISWAIFYYIAFLNNLGSLVNEKILLTTYLNITFIGIGYIIYFLFSQLHFLNKKNNKNTFNIFILWVGILLAILISFLPEEEFLKKIIEYFCAISFLLLAGKLIDKHINLFLPSVIFILFTLFFFRDYPSNISWSTLIPLVMLQLAFGIAVTVKLIQGKESQFYFEKAV